MKKKLIKVLQILYLLVVFFFIFKFLKESFRGIDILELKISFSYLILSFLMLLLYMLNTFLIWHYITIFNDCNLKMLDSVYIKSYSELGKYLPGKVFGYAILVDGYKKENKSLVNLSSSCYIQLFASLLSSLIITFIAIFFSDNRLIYYYRYYSLVFVFILIVFMHPKILKFIIQLCFKLFKIDASIVHFSYFHILKIVFLYLINWLFFGVAVIFFIRSVFDVSWGQYFFILGSFAISGLVGMFAFFAPSGMGVREGVLIVALKLIMLPFDAGLVSIFSRVWFIISDFLLFSLLSLVRIKINKK